MLAPTVGRYKYGVIQYVISCVCNYCDLTEDPTLFLYERYTEVDHYTDMQTVIDENVINRS